MGGRIYGPYTGRYFSSRRKTDIEHIVARSEAHDSGLCRADSVTKRDFARDLLHLTLAAPEVNRCGRNGKCHCDAAEWLPPLNRCWFARRVLDVRRKREEVNRMLRDAASDAKVARSTLRTLEHVMSVVNIASRALEEFNSLSQLNTHDLLPLDDDNLYNDYLDISRSLAVKLGG